ncbi:hypothetical protein FI667_g1476, partial [Globisporangium splendens]
METRAPHVQADPNLRAGVEAIHARTCVCVCVCVCIKGLRRIFKRDGRRAAALECGTHAQEGGGGVRWRARDVALRDAARRRQGTVAVADHDALQARRGAARRDYHVVLFIGVVVVGVDEDGAGCHGTVSFTATAAASVQTKQQVVKLHGTSHALRHIFQTEGVRGLFSGLSPTMMIAVPSTVLYYISYDLLLQTGRQHVPEYDAIVPLLAGTTARIVAASVTSPIELIRTRMQGNPTSQADGIVRTFHRAIRSGGYQSLLNGLVATLARDVPFSAIYWTSYEGLQAKFTQAEPEVSFSRTQRAFACGALSGAIAATLTTPFDVVKTLQQVKMPSAMGPNSAKSSGVAVLKQIVAIQGVQGAFTGLSARLARVTPSCAIMISCYELGKQKLGLV